MSLSYKIMNDEIFYCYHCKVYHHRDNEILPKKCPHSSLE